MSLPHRFAAVVTDHSRIVFVALLLLTALVGAGMPMVDDDSSLDQFETDSPEAQAMDDIDDRFGTDDNTTAVQLITRGDGENVLERESLLSSLEFQQEIQANESMNATLADDDPITGVENLVAITANATEQGEELEERGEELGEREAELEARSAQLEAGINESRDLQREYEELSDEYDEDAPEYQEGAAEIEEGYDDLLAEITAEAALDDEQAETYEEFAGQARMLESDLYELEQSVDDPDQLEESEEYQELQEGFDDVYAGATMGVLEDEYAQLEDDFDAFEADQEALEEDDERMSLDEQIETLETIDEETFEQALEDTLSDGDNGEDGPGLAFMPSEYEPGSTEAEARMTSIMQDTGGDDLEMGAADGGNGVIDAQQDLGTLASAHEHDHVVFGVGIITDEIDRSMVDSLSIVGPLALAFVAAALFVAYRDPLDIVLGLVGIVAVLVWTFGFMGWAGISFNQMFVAVPVLLIGLSIDYAIHVFMRHREQREASRASAEADRETESGAGVNTVRGSMSIALAGVGVALLWVTATTAIGFLANLISPIGPIQEFGVVSSVGIVSA